MRFSAMLTHVEKQQHDPGTRDRKSREFLQEHAQKPWCCIALIVGNTNTCKHVDTTVDINVFLTPDTICLLVEELNGP
ncbi:unnamed protein product [Arctogadus glacialis]